MSTYHGYAAALVAEHGLRIGIEPGAGVLGPAMCWGQAATVAVTAIAFYVLVYTLLLKRRTSQNIVWGGAAGCMPGGHRMGRGHR